MRPSWDEYFCDLVQQVATRATCDRGRSGCVVVRDRRIVCTGYVGSPPGMPHCDEVGHDWRRVLSDDGTVRTHCIRTVHAEQNALAQAARHGLPLAGAVIYCTMEPCLTCAMLLVSVGISKVVALKRYHAAEASRTVFQLAGVELVLVEDVLVTYPNQEDAR